MLDVRHMSRGKIQALGKAAQEGASKTNGPLKEQVLSDLSNSTSGQMR